MRRSGGLALLFLIGAVALFVFLAWDDFLRLVGGVAGPGVPPADSGIRSERIPDEWYHCANADDWFSPRAIDAMLEAAEAGDALAQYSAGIAHMTGLGVACSPSDGAAYLLEAADQGMPQAEYAAGLVYFWGHGLPADPAKAKAWFAAAAEDDHAGALNALALSELEAARSRLESGDTHVETCLTGDCLVWIRSTLERAAQAGSRLALVNLGFVYGYIGQQLDDRGYGSEAWEYYEEAYFWFALATLYLDDAESRVARDFLQKTLPPPVVARLDERAARWRPDDPPSEANDPVDTDPGQFF